MMRILFMTLPALMATTACSIPQTDTSYETEYKSVHVSASTPVRPVLAGTEDTPVIMIDMPSGKSLHTVSINLSDSDIHRDIESISLWTCNEAGQPVNVTDRSDAKSVLALSGSPANDAHHYCIAVSLSDSPLLSEPIRISIAGISTDTGLTGIAGNDTFLIRKAIPLRTQGQDGVHTSRIPGLVTTPSGTLIAVFDARHDSSRDLQGDIDIAMHRSIDGGLTWEPMKIIMDMGEYGGLPARFNGVSDPCVTVDDKTGKIFVFATWMHGIIDPDTKAWIDDIDETTDLDAIWEHHWTRYASLPGWSPYESAQFMMVSSSDDGKTWSDPVNLTGMIKPEDWYLLCPCPGNGITMSDGTLVVPVSGRDRYVDPFASIIYSHDHGMTWKLAQRIAYSQGGECTIAELTDGSLMLNTHLRSNAGLSIEDGNGRGVVTTSDLGRSWNLHPTDHTLIEPPCEASLLSHRYISDEGETQDIMVFFNPHSCEARVDLTLQTSTDDGFSWPEKRHIIIDEGPSNGYSSMTSIDGKTIGLLYESSNAQLSFLQISLEDIITLK